MASTGAYTEADSAQMGGGSGLYVNQNGGTPPPQQQQQQQPPQQQQHVPTDPDLQFPDIAQQLQRSSEMMHAGAPQTHQMNAALNAHHQFQTPPRPTHSPQAMAQSVMNLEEHMSYSDHDGGSSRKRSKVSRACDECRRKKIRCDATSENGPEACSSCKRTGARCQFSRQPMKRGPSKGYIKELADRLNSLESQIQHPHAPGPGYDYMSVGDQGLPDIQTPSQFTRKRTHSISEGMQDSYGTSNRQMGWSGQDREYPSNGAVQAIHRRPSYDDMALVGSLITGSNEGVIKAYWTAIHPILPILAQDPSSLNRLTNCPAKLREAFFLALECGVRSFAPLNLLPTDSSPLQLMHRCLEVVDMTQQTLADVDSSRQLYNQIVYCQSLAFLAFASDKFGPAGMTNTAELLGRLAGRISELGLNDSKVLNNIREQDHENFESARRLFWVVFILDRFHASSMSRDIVLPLYCGSVSREDFSALGELAYHLARAADIVGQIAYLIRANSIPNMEPSSPYAIVAMTSSSPSSLYLNGQLSRFRESLDITNLPKNSVPYLAYQYLRIIVARLSPYTASNDHLTLTRDLLGNLMSGPVTPLHHIFASLVATSLMELSDRVETQVEAHASIKEMDDAISNSQIVHRSADGASWDTAIRDLLRQKKAPTPSTSPGQSSTTAQPNMAGLQHLAAAAVGEREGADAVRPSSSGGSGPLPPPSDMKHDVAAAVAAASEAAAAQATAAAAQKQLQNSSGNGNGGNNYDASALVKEGFMTALS
ncbi:uncharacterized protein BDR25DRAFT_55263 [Lindgomyces ingoldianus]|uniref:Uncharacterized protein n=1 Tax=Lindgomyces ingoldianus TaxID=673940 RepID=A0ACB6QQX8_9PLEO|nr:uncharacterized protein BDR25DRAFT_55263 [Lindgomyces ingoldianus]KAF2468487.1 hypothetical protein BDR25DRAFT_55263 [Lindgomyces ingoldianus]